MKYLLIYKRVNLLGLLSLLLMANSYAEEVNSSGNYQNRFDVAISFGELEVESGADFDARQLEASYDLQFKAGYYFGIAYLAGENGGSLDTANFLRDDKLEYQALAIKSGYRYKPSKKQSLYAELMLLNFSLDYATRSTKLSQDEIGWGIGSGWRYRINDRVSVSVGLQRLTFDEDITVTNTKLSLGYAF